MQSFISELITHYKRNTDFNYMVYKISDTDNSIEHRGVYTKMETYHYHGKGWCSIKLSLNLSKE